MNSMPSCSSTAAAPSKPSEGMKSGAIARDTRAELKHLKTLAGARLTARTQKDFASSAIWEHRWRLICDVAALLL
jgi:hypothetical protein